jgi:hypothetical protein
VINLFSFIVRMKTDVDEYDDEDLGVFITDEECLKMEKMINNVGRVLIVSVPIIVGYLILLTAKSVAL